MTPAPVPTTLNYVASTFYACGSVTSRLKIQPPRMSSTRFHTKPRSRSPPTSPSAHSTAVALTPPPIPAETVEALAQDPATVRTLVQIISALVPAREMRLTLTPAVVAMEDRSPFLRGTLSLHHPCWFIRPDHPKLL